MALRDGWDRLRGLFSRAEMEREIAEEVAYHLERETERNLRAGMSPSEARRQALIAFGGSDRFVEASREEHRSRRVEDFLSDARVALRGLRRAPLFTLTAVLSLAVGIGANTAMFSVVQSVLLRPLPYPSPEELVWIGVKDDNRERASALSDADHLGLLEARTLAAVGAWGVQPGGFAVVANGEVESVPGSWATAGLFRALGVAPVRGRLFVEEDHEPGAGNAVILSYGYWQERFGGAADVIGSAIEIDGVARDVVGVMPKGFHFPGEPEDRLWIALELITPEWRAPFWLRGVARLAPHVAAEAARSELDRVRESVLARYPESPSGWRYEIDPTKETLVANARLTLLVLLAAVGLVLAIAAANVANLLLARTTTRAPELAVRSALGAGRARLAWQLFAESVLLAGVGGAVGVLLAWAAVEVLPAFVPRGLPRGDEIALDGAVLSFALLTTLAVGVLVGVLPAMRATRTDLMTRIREGGLSGSGGRRANARAALVVLEFALAVAIVVGAGLVMNSLVRLQRVDPGVETEGVLTARVALPESNYPEPEAVASFFDRLIEEVRALPGVQAAGLGMAAPPNRLAMRNPFTPEGKVYATNERAPVAVELLVDPGFFEALGIRPVRGRLFDARDRADAPLVAIIDETLAREHFPGVDPIGRWLQTGDPSPDAARLTIVGVVPEVKYSGLDAPPEPTIYVPFAQNLWWRSMYLFVRTRGEPIELAPSIRTRVAQIDPRIPVREFNTVEQLARESVSTPRFRALLLGSFSGISLLLACAGIYGVLAYDVAQRRRETGIRIAIGADRNRIIAEIVGRGMRHALLGILIGSAGAAALTRLMRGLLFEVDPLDPTTFATAVAILAGVGLAACALPALRASRTDPLSALRSE